MTSKLDELKATGLLALLLGMFTIFSVVLLPTIFVFQQNFDAFIYWLPIVYLIGRGLSFVTIVTRITHFLSYSTTGNFFYMLLGIPYDIFMIIWGYPLFLDIYTKMVTISLPAIELQKDIILLVIWISLTHTINALREDKKTDL